MSEASSLMMAKAEPDSAVLPSKVTALLKLESVEQEFRKEWRDASEATAAINISIVIGSRAGRKWMMQVLRWGTCFFRIGRGAPAGWRAC